MCQPWWLCFTSRDVCITQGCTSENRDSQNCFITKKGSVLAASAFCSSFLRGPTSAGAGRRGRKQNSNTPLDQINSCGKAPLETHRHKRNVGCIGRLVNYSPSWSPERLNISAQRFFLIPLRVMSIAGINTAGETCTHFYQLAKFSCFRLRSHDYH